MSRFRQVVLAVLIVFASGQAWALDRLQFMSLLKKVGIGGFDETKRACMCLGGNGLDHRLGLATAEGSSQIMLARCWVLNFNGLEFVDAVDCIGNGGTSFEILSK